MTTRTSARPSTWQTSHLPPTVTLLSKHATMTCLPEKEKYKETNALFRHPAYRVVRFHHRLRGKWCRNKLPEDRMSKHYPSTIYRPTSQTTDHNKCMSSHSPIYFGFHVFLGCGTMYSRDGEERLERHEERKNIRYKCISCCSRCVPPAGVNSDQRPFII